MIQDKIKATLKIYVNSELWEVIDIVTNEGVKSAAQHLGSNSNNDSWMPFIAIGDGITAPSTEDVQLEHELYRKRGVVTVIDNTYFVEADFDRDEPTEDAWIREIGIFDIATGGRMGARWLLVDEIYKEYDVSINIRCAITLT